MYRLEAIQEHERGVAYDHPLPIVRSRHWILLWAVAIAIVAALIWACVARVPVTVQSQGILLHSTGVAQIETLSFGEVLDIKVGRNAFVRQGDILAELRLGNLEAEMQLTESRLRVLEANNIESQALENKKLDEHRDLVLQKRQGLQESIASLTTLMNRNQQVEALSLETREQRIDELLSRSMSFLTETEQQLTSVRKLFENRLATQTDKNRLDAAVLEAYQGVSQLSEQRSALDLQQIKLEQSTVEIQIQLVELRHTLREIDYSLTSLESQIAAERLRRDSEIQNQRNTLQTLKERFDAERFLRSPCSGTILELTIQPGGAVRAGQVVGAIAREGLPNTSDLQVTAFFPVAAGKQIAVSAEAFVTPTNVERERQGSLLAEVVDVYAFPLSVGEATRIVGNREVLSPLSKLGGVLGVQARLQSRVATTTAANIDSASPSEFENPPLSRDETNRSATQPSTSESTNDYRWTSGRPGISLSAGTTVTVQVVVERRRPISYLLPSLYRSFYGPLRTAGSQ